ncbi:MAG: ribbon-helix-helix protein, CopG family [Eubacterium limosum]|nr:ribbon-helix-helix protein, CopG family [Eubacterium limosum]
MERIKQKTIRLTIRLTESLEELIRKEAEARGKSVNQMMVYMLNAYFSESEKTIGPKEDS